ncbi:MAG: glucose-6-phosphate dehydrogenase [Oligoflexia bacterium]|nr:glucose-6-phosphate dehydrogenase [Oligoflexia bacterium]
MENPFAEGENRILRPPATAMVIFGATGDLNHRKLMPALYNLAEDEYLPAAFLVIGTGRTKLSDEQFRADMRKAVSEHSRREVKAEIWEAFSKNIFYQPLDIGAEADFVLLRQRLEAIAAERGETFNYLYYLATAPNFFGAVATNLGKAGLSERPGSGIRSTSLVVEKPFGVDLESARTLNSTLRQSFEEKQILRIDHYLGKETVQNILVFRFANGIFEPLWNRNYVDHIQVSVCEDIGVGNRAGYFDQSGIMRDIVQNHLLQMLSLLCIEAPISLSDADSIRDEKVKVVRAMKRFRVEEVASHTVRAQYTRGFIAGENVNGYLEEQGVRKGSSTDTFVAMKLEIENWRWSGVPIYIRAGKRLPKRITEITVYFKRPPESLFRGRQVEELEHNVLAIQVQPKEGISLKVSSKAPGPRMRVRPVVMDFTYGSSFGVPSADAYERLLLDAMRGDATLFTRDDEIEEAWALLAPVFEAWSSSNVPVHTYEAGSWGPRAAAALLRPSGHRWRRL